MAFEITKVDVWVCELEDKPGALAEKLGAVMRAGANLDFTIARPLGGASRAGVLFVAPLVGAAQFRAAEEVGLRKSHIQILRVEGPDRPGLGAGLATTLAEAGINIAGLAGSALADRCLFYIRFGSSEDVVRAAQVLTRVLA